MIETRKKKDKEQHKFPMTKFLSLALGQNFKMLIFFSLFYGNNQNFQDQAPLFFFCIPIRQSRKKIQEHTFFYVYITVRSRIQQEHYLMILMFNNSRGCKNPNFF